jgi:hypothetical protein
MEDCGDKRGDTVSIPYNTRTNLGIKGKTGSLDEKRKTERSSPMEVRDQVRDQVRDFHFISPMTFQVSVEIQYQYHTIPGQTSGSREKLAVWLEMSSER